MGWRWLVPSARLLLALYLLLLVWLVLGEQPVSERLVFDRLVLDLSDLLGLSVLAPSTAQREALANLVLFVPFGLLLPVAFPGALLTLLVLVPALLALGVEVAQLLLLDARVSSRSDVVMNVLGAALGLAPGADLRRLVSRPRRAP